MYMSEYRNQSFLAQLIQKEASVKLALTNANKPITAESAIVKEVHRQQRQISKKRGGNPYTGEGVTKSGGDD